MTKNEIIYTIVEKLRIHSDDSDFSEELISSMIDTKRAMLMRQLYSKSPWQIPPEVRQTLSIDMELVDRVDGYCTGGKILMSDLPLPVSIKVKGKDGPLIVKNKDMVQIPINIISIERLPYLFNNKYTQHLIYCAKTDSGKIILISKDDKHRFLKEIRVTDIFENPEEARQLQSGMDFALDDWEYEYPVELAMVDTIVELVFKDLAASRSLPSDNTNDAADGSGSK